MATPTPPHMRAAEQQLAEALKSVEKKDVDLSKISVVRAREVARQAAGRALPDREPAAPGARARRRDRARRPARERARRVLVPHPRCPRGRGARLPRGADDARAVRRRARVAPGEQARAARRGDRRRPPRDRPGEVLGRRGRGSEARARRLRAPVRPRLHPARRPRPEEGEGRAREPAGQARPRHPRRALADSEHPAPARGEAAVRAADRRHPACGCRRTSRSSSRPRSRRGCPS